MTNNQQAETFNLLLDRCQRVWDEIKSESKEEFQSPAPPVAQGQLGLF